MKNIYLIAGKSGTGKDTIVNALCNLYGYKRVASYTTRRPREDDNDTYSHEFVDMDGYRWDKECGQIMAETFYNGNYYWATTHQIDENDLYIVDIRGIETIKDRYRGKGIGKALFKAFGIDTPGRVFTVNAALPAYGFYKKMGFVPTDIEKIEDGLIFTPMKKM